MKRWLILVGLFLYCLPNFAANSKDSIWIKGVVRPDEAKYPFKILKHVSVSLLKNDHTIGKTFSDDSGKFQLRCALQDVKASLQLLLEARSAQPVITYDSICPYLVNKTSDRYFDRYVDLNLDMLHGHQIYKEVYMSPPLQYTNNCMIFKSEQDCVADMPCVSKDQDTMCICIVNLFNIIKDLNLVPTIWVRSYYSDNADSARIRADKVAILLQRDYKIDGKYVKVVTVSESENDKFVDPYAPRCNYVVVNIMLEKIMSEKDR